MAQYNIAIPSVQVTADRDFIVVQAPADLTGEEKRAAIACLISTLRATPIDHLEAVQLVFNILQLGVDGMASVLTSPSSVRLVHSTPTRQQFLEWVGLEDSSGQGAKPPFPTLPGPVPPEAMGVTSPMAIQIALASLLFGLGKQASESARAATMDKRPDALIRRFEVKEEDQLLLPGREVGPSRESLEMIYNAFSNITEVRAAVVKFFIGLKRQAQHLPLSLEVLMTNFQLMRGAGMTHVDAIIKLARMHPWTLRVPKLEPYYRKFTEDLTKFEQVPADVRPYHRLLVPQSDYLFISTELRPLIAVAGSFIEEVEKTFGGYVYNKSQYQDLIEDIKSRAPGYTPSTGMSRLAALLQVPDEPLPPRQGPVRRPQEETV